MKNITKISSSKQLKASWDKVFLNKDPFMNPFHSSFNEILIFYPTYGYHLEKNQYESLIKTLKQCEVDRFFISEVEYKGDFFRKGQHWECIFPSYKHYLEIPLVLENAVYSQNGTFGMILSQQDHAVIAGSKIFIKALKQNYPCWTNDEKDLLREWEENPYLRNTEIVNYFTRKNQHDL